ncbi:MAG: hypothetical protein IJR13_08210 [Bacteroidales bacterium]|nr:hypothetical protein [Bacteroidales bacterium]
MEIMMRAEQEEYIKQTELYRNGYRPRKVYGCGKVFEFGYRGYVEERFIR